LIKECYVYLKSNKRILKCYYFSRMNRKIYKRVIEQSTVKER